MNELPYYSVFRNFEERVEIMKRNDIYSSGPPSPIVSEEALGLVKQYAGKTILDIGCGIGAYINRLVKENYICEGIEYNQACVTECIKNGLSVKYMSAEKIEYPDNSFDTVMMIEVLEHLPDPIKALDEAFRVAKNNVIISVPNINVVPLMSKYQVVPWHLLEGTHLNFFTPKLLEQLLQQRSKETVTFTYGHFAHWIKEEPMHMHVFGVGVK